MYAFVNNEGRLLLRPSSNQTNTVITAFRVVLWLTWGPPPRPSSLACHFACDHHMCLNPAHGRWGTAADNRNEAQLLEAFKEDLKKQPPHLKDQFTRENLPARHLLARQGFNWLHRM